MNRVHLQSVRHEGRTATEVLNASADQAIHAGAEDGPRQRMRAVEQLALDLRLTMTQAHKLLREREQR